MASAFRRGLQAPCRMPKLRDCTQRSGSGEEFLAITSSRVATNTAGILTAKLRPQKREMMRLLGVRRPDAALLSLKLDRGQSGVRPPHSKVTPYSSQCSEFFVIRRHRSQLRDDVRKHAQRRLDFVVGVVPSERKSNRTLCDRIRHVHRLQRR